MLNKIKSYFTLRAETTTKLDEMVNAEIAKGSQPYGSPYTFDEAIEGTTLKSQRVICQVVVRQGGGFTK